MGRIVACMPRAAGRRVQGCKPIRQEERKTVQYNSAEGSRHRPNMNPYRKQLCVHMWGGEQTGMTVDHRVAVAPAENELQAGCKAWRLQACSCGWSQAQQ